MLQLKCLRDQIPVYAFSARKAGELVGIIPASEKFAGYTDGGQRKKILKDVLVGVIVTFDWGSFTMR